MGSINIKNAVAWVIGVFLLLLGVVIISDKYLLGPLLLIISGILAVPPSFNFINTKLKSKISTSLRIVLIIILFVLGIKFYPSIATNYVSPSNNNTPEVKTEQSEVKVNTDVDAETTIEKGIVVSVTDGDTVRINLNGKEVPVRLIGIDTPEISHPSEPVQCYGPEAKKALEELILNKEVILEKDISDKDQYDRYLRYLWIGEVMINEYMTQNGYGFASAYPPDIKYQNRINAGEQAAKSALKGLWSKDTCNGDVYTGTYKDPNKNVTELTQPTTNTNSTYVAPVVSTTPQNNNSSTYTCNCKKTCPQMSSCAEAQYQLNICGCSARDGDDDGIACDSDCQ